MERVFKTGSPADFDPGMHTSFLGKIAFGFLLDCATPMWRSRGGWRIPSCFLQELLQFLSWVFGAHERFANQECLVACAMQLADFRSTVNSALRHAQHMVRNAAGHID